MNGLAEGGAYVVDPATGERRRVEWTREPPAPGEVVTVEMPIDPDAPSDEPAKQDEEEQ